MAKDNLVFKWDERQQKLEIHDSEEKKDDKTNAQWTTNIVQVYNKEKANQYRHALEKKIKSLRVYLDQVELMEKDFKNKDNLPYYKEVKAVLNAINFEFDMKLKEQFEVSKKDYDETKKELDKVNKVLPI